MDATPPRVPQSAANLPASSSGASSSTAAAAALLRAKEQEQERAALLQLESEVARHKARVTRHKENEEVLQQQCARHQAKAMGYREKESKAQNELRRMRKLYEDMQERLARAEKEKEVLEQLWDRRERRDGETVRNLEREVERLARENEILRKAPTVSSGTKVPVDDNVSSTITKPILKAPKKVRVQHPDSVEIDMETGLPSGGSIRLKDRTAAHPRPTSTSYDTFPLITSITRGQPQLAAPTSSSSSAATTTHIPPPPPSSSSPLFDSESAFTSGSRTTPSSPTRVVRPLPRRISTNSLSPISPLLPIPAQPKRMRVSTSAGNNVSAYNNSNLAYYKTRANEEYNRKIIESGKGLEGDDNTERGRWLVNAGSQRSG